MTIPDVFAEVWNRTGGDLKAAVTAVKMELRGGMPKRPAQPAPSFNRDESWSKARKIAAAIAEDCEVPLAELVGQSRKQVHVQPRQLAMLMIRQTLILSYPGIGQIFGGRNHATVMAACDRSEVWLASRPGVYARLLKLAEAAIAEQPAVAA